MIEQYSMQQRDAISDPLSNNQTPELESMTRSGTTIVAISNPVDDVSLNNTLVLSVYGMSGRTLQILIIKELVLLHFIYVLMVHRHNRETISIQSKQLNALSFIQFHNIHIIAVHYFKFNS